MKQEKNNYTKGSKKIKVKKNINQREKKFNWREKI